MRPHVLQKLRLRPRTVGLGLAAGPLLLLLLFASMAAYRLAFPTISTNRWAPNLGPFEELSASGIKIDDVARLATGGEDERWHFTMPGVTERRLTLAHALDLRPYRALRIPLKLHGDRMGRVQVKLRLIHHNGWIYETQAETPVDAGRETVLEIDLSAGSSDFSPVGHGRPWDGESSRAAERIILKARSTRAFKGSLEVGRPEWLPAPSSDARLAEATKAGLPVLEELAPGPKGPPPWGANSESPRWFPADLEVLDAEAASAPGEVNVSLRLHPEPLNPFDPEQCDVRVLLAPAAYELPRRDAASGELNAETVAQARPAYFDQHYVRLPEARNPAEELRPYGRPCFRARIPITSNVLGASSFAWTRQAGAVVAHVLLNGRKIASLPVELPEPSSSRPADAGDLLAIQRRLAGGAPLPDWTGSGGEAFSGRYAPRPELTGLPWQAEAAWYLGRNVELGKGEPGGAEPDAWRYGAWTPETVCWRPPLEWNDEWGKWQGLGRYDLELCWRFDRILEQAQAEGLSLPVLITADDRFFNQGKFRWPMNPLSSQSGGPVEGPGEFFLKPAARDSVKRMLRYLAARYGASPALGGWLFGATLPARGVPEWHAALASAAEELEAAQGLVHLNLDGLPAGGEEWLASERGRRPILSLHPWATPFEGASRRNSFEAGEPDHTLWKPEQRLSPGTELTVNIGQASDGTRSAALRGKMPGQVCLVRELLFKVNEADNFYEFQSLVFDVYVPHVAPHDMRAMVHLRDRDLLWYETLLDPLLRNGDWTRVVVDLSGENKHKLKPVNHQRPWDDYSRTRVREIGIRIFCMHKYDGPIYIDNIHMLGKQQSRPIPQVTPHVAFRPGTALKSERYDKWEVDFDLNKSYPNPYDPEVVDVTALIETPSGKTERVPCFFYEPYDRQLVKKPIIDTLMGRHITRTVELEEIMPIAGGMAGFWKLRYAPKETGTHTVKIEVREGGKWLVKGERWIPDDRFTADGQPLPWRKYHGQFTEIIGKRADGRRRVQEEAFEPGPVATRSEALVFEATASNLKGFVQVASDGKLFEFSNGEPYYPIGINLATPSEEQLPYFGGDWDPPGGYERLRDIGHRGTYQYDEYFEAFQKHGLNWAKVWMATWWTGLEWRRDWPPFQGVGRYSQPNAWKMDHLVEEARRRNVYLQVILMNHGQVSTGINSDWENCPYAAELGGPLKSAREFYSEAEGKKLYKNKLRYIAARWGYSTSVLDWTLCGEMDFTEEYQTNSFNLHVPSQDLPAPETMVLWVDEMSRYMKEFDCGKHLIGTHISHPQRGQNIQFAKGLDYVQSNAYSGFPWLADGKMDAVRALDAYYWGQTGLHHFEGMQRFGKPVLVCEQGGHWHGRSYKYGDWTRNTRQSLEADLHCGLWGGIMTPMAGQTGYWWWIHVHFDGTYQHLEGASRFMSGEDLRGQDFRRGPIVLDSPEHPYKAVAFKNRTRGYAWIYHVQLPHSLNAREYSGMKAQVYAMLPGTYEIEYWHTVKGEVIKREQVAAQPSKLREDHYLGLALPPFEGDIAVKFRRIEKP